MTDSLPALLGGRPVCPEGPPGWPLPDPDVLAAIVAAATAGAWGRYHGEHIGALEAELATFHGVPHALTCASGTLAVEAALRALRVGPGDEVIVAAYEYESNFLSVHALGASPVLVDVHPVNANLDPAHLEAAITPRTRAILCSHLHGGLVPMREVLEIVGRGGISVVEDAAQAPGATVQGRLAGTWGHVGTLSFGGSKLLAAGRGGAMLFRDPLLHQRAKVWLHRGLQQWAPLSELQAAAVRPQLRSLPDATARRWERVQLLNRLCSGTPGLVPFVNSVADSTPAYYKVGFWFDPAAFGLGRELFVRAVRAEGVALDVGFKALHVNRAPSRFRAAGELTHATAAHRGCVILHHPVLAGGEADLERVAEAIARAHRAREALSSLEAGTAGPGESPPSRA